MITKRFFAIAGLVAVLALAACSAGAPAASGSNQPQPRTISVQGSGKVTLAPDVAYVFVGVESRSDNVGDALNANNAKAQAISATLKELGIEDKDIQTSGFNIFPNQQYDPEGKLVKTEYVVNNTVNVTVRDLTLLGKLLDAVVRSGANSINGITFDIFDKQAAVAQARSLAIADAKAQAEAIAKDAGVTLGNVMSVSVYSSGGQPVYDAKGGVGAVMNSQVPVSAGSIILSVDASMSFEIK